MGFSRPVSVPGFATSDPGDPQDPARVQQVLAASDDLPWVDVASAATTPIGAANSNKVRVTGTTTITALGTVGIGVRRLVRFADALTLTHHATSLILPGSANITTAANDTAEFVSLGSGNWLCAWYKKASGLFLASSRAMLEALGTWRVLASSAVQVSHTGDTNAFTLATITIPAGQMGANGRVRITVLWSNNNSGNDKTLEIKFGGTSFNGSVHTTAVARRDQCEIANRNAANSQVGNNGMGQGGFGSGASAAIVTAAIDTASAVDITLVGTLANAADSVAVEGYLVELFYAA